MKNRISYYLGQNGYLKMMTNLSEFTIYFKKENGFVSMIEVVDMKENPYITEDMLHNVIQKAQWRFRDQGIEEIHYLVLVLGENMERAAALGEREYFFFMIDSGEGAVHTGGESGRLLRYERADRGMVEGGF